MSQDRRDRIADLVSSLWFLPATAVAVALVLGALLASIRVPESWPMSDLLFRGDAESARQLLTVVTGTMITVTSLVFALTVVALQIASTQFSPRLLRSFLRDRPTQLVLSTFVGTVAYALAGLHTVGSVTADGPFVPQLAITGALVLALLSVGMLVFYIHHLTDSIRIDSIMRRVERQTLALIARRLPTRAKDRPPNLLPEPPADAVVFPAPTSGYVQRLHLTRLEQAALSTRTVVRVVPALGFHVTEARPLALVWPSADTRRAGDGALTAVPPRLADVLARTIELAAERHVEVDIGLGLRQLVDIGSRALGPSLNDPYTAVQAVHHLTVLFTDLAGRQLEPLVIRDELGQVRVGVPVLPFEDHLRVVCEQLRQHARGQTRVAVELLRLLENAAGAAVGKERLDALRRELDLIVADIERAVDQPADLVEVHAAADRARAALA